VNYFESYSTEPVDTIGGGDSFRAGIVYGFLKAWNDEAMIGFAAAVATISCSRFPGVQNSPTYDEVAGFIKARLELV
jgi:sugar/nucleoside kinase (ribokinase family)